jgi:hypothetical protein
MRRRTFGPAEKGLVARGEFSIKLQKKLDKVQAVC